MKGRVLTTDLHRLAYNALLYSKVNSDVKGYSLWIRGAHGIRVVANDNYFILSDRCDATEYSGQPLYALAAVAELRAAERLLAKETEDYVDISDFGIFSPEPEAIVQRLMDADEMVFGTELLKRAPTSTFAIAADRLRKLALVKPGDYPIDLRVFGGPGGQSVAYRIGPTVRGLIAPLNRDKLKGLYGGDELWQT